MSPPPPESEGCAAKEGTLWRRALDRPAQVVCGCFLVVSLLLLLLAGRALLLLGDDQLQTASQTLRTQATGIGAMFHAERSSLYVLRDYAEYLTTIQATPYGDEPEGLAKSLYVHRDDRVWQAPTPAGGASLIGVGPDMLAGLDGFERNDATLLKGIHVLLEVGRLMTVEAGDQDARRRTAYISRNGMFVSYPPSKPDDAITLFHYFNAAEFYRAHLPQNNPTREMKWFALSHAYRGVDKYASISVPVYYGHEFRGVAIVDISQKAFEEYLVATNDRVVSDTSTFLMDGDGNLVYSSKPDVEHWPVAELPDKLVKATPQAMLAQGSGTLRVGLGNLLFQRVPDSDLLLVRFIPGQMFAGGVISHLGFEMIVAAVALAALLWTTLRIVTLLFASYVERGNALLKLADHDPLTGLANRRAFSQRYQIEEERGKREHTELALLMLDIDFFKKVNDRWGHASGDRVLQALADTCRHTVRAVDLTARLGGEEFAVMMPGATLAEAVEAAERLRAALAAIEVKPAMQIGVVNAAKGPIRFTVSIGVAEARDTGTYDLDDLLAIADRRLYAAKQTGRDRVVSDDSHEAGVAESATT